MFAPVVRVSNNYQYALVKSPRVRGAPFDERRELVAGQAGGAGDTLVVVTKNMNGYIKVDTIGHPLSSQATFTQTFRRTSTRRPVSGSIF